MPLPPFSNWTTAATNIQDAVDAAAPGDEIVVTNGTYTTGGRVVSGTVTNRVAVNKMLNVRSVNGPQVTSIQGYQVLGTTNGPAAIRCVYLASGASLFGFTLTNGATELNGSGGGVWCESTSALVSNCILAGNIAFDGGGAYSGTLYNCTLNGNLAIGLGGGAYGSSLYNCTLNANSALWDKDSSVQGGGGGAAGGTLYHCILSSNVATGFGGGGTLEAMLHYCVLSNNVSYGIGGGVYGGSLDNSLVTSNSAYYGAGVCFATLSNCTVTGNSALRAGGGAFASTVYNSILYYNSAESRGPNYDTNNTLSYCCATPLADGPGNFTNPPLFMDYAGGNLRLQSNSPCINSGLNAYAPPGLDLEGNPRIAQGTADVGAYEFQQAASRISYAWLQWYGFPSDGSADEADPDADGMSNWQEFIAGTNPTNSDSVLKMLAPSKEATGLAVSWQSVGGTSYFLQRSENSTLSLTFSILRSNIVGKASTTTLLDTNAVGPGPFLYRVGVEH